MRLKTRRAICEQLEIRQLLSGTYVVPEVSDLALSQPQINYTLTRPNDTSPLGDFFAPAFLDTGTSGNIESTEYAQQLGIQNQTYGPNHDPVLFEDVGISGSAFFNVAEPLKIALANHLSLFDEPADSDFTPAGTYTMEVNPNPTADGFGDAIDIIGMPALMGKVMVLDPRPLFSTDPDALDDMKTFVYGPNTPFNPNDTDNPGIPATSLKVKFSFADFAPYTFTDPAGAPGPTLTSNPIIGPNPLRVFQSNPAPDNTPPVSMSYNGQSATGSFIFDTGAVGSFMSRAEAAKFGVFYRAGTYGTDSPILVDASNNPIVNQGVIPFGGLDGSETDVSEFVLDSLSVTTTDGIEIRFTNMPISVLDINLTDPVTGNVLIDPTTHLPFVIDGDFGVNPLLGSSNNGTVPAFNYITFNTVDQTIGFAPTGSISSGTATVAGRRLFYDNSSFDGHVSGASPKDDLAIAADKSPLFSTDQSSSFSNISSYPAGINGIMLDIKGLPGTPVASDFNFLIGNSTSSPFQVLTTQPTITLRPGAGGGGSTRIELTWPDGTIKNEWLQVTVKADALTGLAAPDTFLFGSLIGSSGQPTSPLDSVYKVSSADVTAAQNDPHGFTNPVNTLNTHDYNRDGRVDITDQLIARYSIGNSIVIFGSSLGFSPIPATTAAAAGVTPTTSKTKNKKAAAVPLTRSQMDTLYRQKAFKGKKQRAIATLKQLISTAGLIKNPKVRKQLVASYKAQLTEVRAATVVTPGILAQNVRMF